MLKVKKRILVSIISIILFIFILDRFYVGKEIDTYKGIPIFYNGILMLDSHGKNYNKDGYYYGQKWQCVEFIKRFFYDIYGHVMPNGMGHAASYFNEKIEDGKENLERGLIQYHNGSYTLPAEDDLLVFKDTISKFGHVAIISKVLKDSIEIVQQNQFIITRKLITKVNKNGRYFLGENEFKIAGWLRVKK